ncbi:hypothetical protein HZS38_06950 [Xenorhabdus nematophila]|uniref:Uncharacterized protein n=2 Tax=Xenorhabdus nematophila TaxID=628 RepID=D3VFJ0_XENNA|nr:hypothetical protein [Xenorhabdus nematophila]CEE94380.1 conserved hypothetical protein [Xenorhabdus nematophila str. Anatoliense]CEF30303.1 conserved hypothetical protein [Xenorhabdus nematophila str. Websteri]AYA40232.1 hypothetical protein D3790_07015 [Xenorhabdus nematophila]MBA0018900.1 hypothetical protein [Xenorhabdus nematophila]MCB4424950.1 hypothetical protein [Xenorhabdus nematophila]
MNLTKEQERTITRLIRESNKQYTLDNGLKFAESMLIRAGIAGDLPFNSLTTDVVTGCLPESMACYGICFSAISSWKSGIDFGKRIDNKLDEDIFTRDLKALPNSQKYIRCGWNSDPSWNWLISTRMAELAREAGLLMIFITKSFKKMTDDITQRLIAIKAEMRVSISALDTNEHLKQRLSFVEGYRNAGGIVIPIVLTAYFKDIALMERQQNIVDWMVKHDYPAAENSLRFPHDAKILELVDPNMARPLDKDDAFWSGRLYPDKLLFPTTTTIPEDYQGINSGYLSDLNLDEIHKLFTDPVKTHQEVMHSDLPLSSPKMCGVSDTHRHASQYSR